MVGILKLQLKKQNKQPLLLYFLSILKWHKKVGWANHNYEELLITPLGTVRAVFTAYGSPLIYVSFPHMAIF